jgi:outer membrane receptor protein involved in Fe transport
MRLLKVAIIAIFSLLVSFTSMYSQPPARNQAGGGQGYGNIQGSVQGIIIDKDSKQPIEYATVMLLKKGDSTLVTGSVTEANGQFLIDNVQPGRYLLKYSFIGYKTSFVDTVSVSPRRKDVKLGELTLSSSVSTLNEVVITGEKSLYETKIDRKVFNVDKAIVAQSGNAADVLQQVPSVSVDQEGVVSLRGSENVNILINGRPTLIDKTVLLQQISANSIEKIEVITNPSVKFDSESTNGIINIVLKQGIAQGMNGTVMVSAGSNDKFNDISKYNGSVNINYNPGKYNVFGSYSYRNEENYFKGETKQYFNSGIDRFSNNYGIRARESQMVRMGIDYFASKKFTFGLNGSLNFGNDNDNENENSNMYDFNNVRFLNYTQTTKGKEDNISKEFAAYIDKKFEKDGHILRMDYSYGDGDEDEDNTKNYDTLFWFNQINPTLKRLQTENTSQARNNQIISTDYSLPINDLMKLELGGRINIRDNHDIADFKYFEDSIITETTAEKIDTLNTHNYKYHEDITSLYGTYSITVGNFSVMAGVKTEFANYKFNIIQKDTSLSNYFFSFLPSLHLAQKIDDKNEINLSYGRRINRPRGWDLSPIPDYSHQNVIRIGNPKLKPEYTNSFELGYTYKPEKFTVQPTIFYRIIEDRFNPYRTFDTLTKVSTIRMKNIDLSHSYGFDMAITYSPYKFMNFNVSGSLFQQTIDATDSVPEKSKFSYNGKIMSNIILPFGTAIQVSAFYRSPFITTQGESDPFYMVTLGVKQDFFKGKLTANITYNDIFNTQRFGMVNTTDSDITKMWRKRESSTINVGLTYKFGKAPKNGKKNGKNGQNGDNETQDEMMY